MTQGAFNPYRFDHFDNAQVDVTTHLGNGSIAEPVGTLLNLDAPNSVNCEWAGAIQNAPIGHIALQPGRCYQLETRMPAFAHTTNLCIAGITVSRRVLVANQGIYYITWYPNENQLIADRNADTRLFSGFAGNDPATTPHRYRVYVNMTDSTQYVEGGTAVAKNSISFWASVDDGATAFVHLHTRTLEFTPEVAGVFLRKWAAGAGDNAQASFDYLDAQVFESGAIDKASTERGGGAFSDDPDVLGSAGGPAAHSSPDGQSRGQLVPGPADQATGSIGPFPAGGFGDDPDPLTDAGGPAAHRNPDGLQVAQRVPGGALESTEEPDRPGQAAAVLDAAQAALELPALLGDGHPGRPIDAGGFFDEVDALLGAVPEYNPHTPTTDTEGHTHLDTERVYRAFLYDTDPGRNPGEAWAEPTVGGFTGNARDGTHYTGGVQDAGPVQAPWSAEGAGNNRSSRSSFPTRVLVVVATGEIVLYDLDNWPTSMDVWARCPLGNWYFFGDPNQLQRVFMKNGVLYACGIDIGTNGALWAFDFKRDGEQDALHVIRSDYNGRLLAGKDFTDRGSTSWWEAYTTFRVQSEYLYELAVHQDPSDPLRVWCAMGGEDGFDVIELYDNVPQKDYTGSPVPTANVGDVRSVAIDPSGMLWLAENSKIWRNGFDYQGGVIVDPTSAIHSGGVNGQVVVDRYPIATLPDDLTVKQLVATQNWIFAATDAGVYAVHKTSLEVRLAYSVAGGGGQGVSAASTGGEAIPGNREIVEQALAIWNAQKSAYLMIATYHRGGIAVVRLRDDVVVQSREHNILQEPGAFFTIGFVE